MKHNLRDTDDMAGDSALVLLRISPGSGDPVVDNTEKHEYNQMINPAQKEEFVMSETRDAYVQQLKAKMDEWNAEIDKLEAQADQAEAQTKLEYQKQIEDLRAKRDDLEKKIAQLQQASSEAWEDLKVGTERAWNALGDAVKSAADRFK